MKDELHISNQASNNGRDSFVSEKAKDKETIFAYIKKNAGAASFRQINAGVRIKVITDILKKMEEDGDLCLESGNYKIPEENKN